MKIIVTEGAGFIGSAVIIQYINKMDHEMANLYALAYADDFESLISVSDDSGYCYLDILDYSAVKWIFLQHQSDVIMPLAAGSHVDRSIHAHIVFNQANIVGTYILLEVTDGDWSRLLDEKEPWFRFHHASTDMVYGDPDEKGYFIEETAYAPNSPYSVSKVSSSYGSWFVLAKKIFNLAQQQLAAKKFFVKSIRGIPSTEFNMVAKRPSISMFDTSKLPFGICLLDWEQSSNYACRI